ncbi:hypothetical protein HYU94_03800 [Candidatus Daviesbacteria bacterium]|nr:hypothetical protein [Candidatus Daviesbacteria bacterium]
MDIISQFFSKVWELFWSVWPKNFLFLILAAAVAEVISVTFFRLGGNRGWLAILGYILGFFVVAFYAEGQKYSTLSVSYPIWLVAVAILLSLSAFFIFHEQFSIKWLMGFILTIIGVYLIQTAIPKSS